MKKQETKEESKELAMSGEFFRLKRGAVINMFCLETVTVEGGKVVKSECTEETFLPIAFDKFRRKAGEQFFAAVEQQ